MQRRFEGFSIDQSSVSIVRENNQSFSNEISELFKNTPGELLRFLDSIEGEVPADPEENKRGDMTCMFVSKDGLSLDKYIRVNRTFLKRKIKDNYSRFRFVIIYKESFKA